MASVQHRAIPSARLIQKEPIRLRRPGNLRGRTRHFKVYVDPALGHDGQKDADFVLSRCEADYARISSYFGGLKPGPFNVILFAHSTGAYHNTCGATDLFCDAQTQPANGPYSELQNIMEFVEVFEALQRKGWICGYSNGEGLSRVLATSVYPRALNDFATASLWLNSKRHNYVDHTYESDGGLVANGCSVLFLNWLHYQLRHPWQQIVSAGAPTLGRTYTTLTGATDGFTRFKTLIDSRFPASRQTRFATDNPFPL